MFFKAMLKFCTVTKFSFPIQISTRCNSEIELEASYFSIANLLQSVTTVNALHRYFLSANLHPDITIPDITVIECFNKLT